MTSLNLNDVTISGTPLKKIVLLKKGLKLSISKHSFRHGRTAIAFIRNRPAGKLSIEN